MSRLLLTCFLQYSEFVTANFIAHIMSSNQLSSKTQFKFRNILNDSITKTTTSKTKKTFSYDANFEQNLIDNDIYSNDYDFSDDRDSSRSNNENVILDRLEQSRSSLSSSKFSEKAFRTFKQTNSRALHENDVMSTVFPVIQRDAHISFARNMLFNNLKPVIDCNFVDVKSNFYDEARSAQIDRRIRAELGSYITSSTQLQTSALANFFTEVKSSDENVTVAKRQTCFNDVVSDRDMRKLAAYEVKNLKTVYDNNAYIITSTYHSVIDSLQMYTVHFTQSADSETSSEYFMNQLRSFVMTDTAERFRERVIVFRNVRDLTMKQRNEIIATVNDRIISMSRKSSILKSMLDTFSQFTNELMVSKSETSVDELAQDRSEDLSLFRKRWMRRSVKSNLERDSKKRLKKNCSQMK